MTVQYNIRAKILEAEYGLMWVFNKISEGYFDHRFAKTEKVLRQVEQHQQEKCQNDENFDIGSDDPINVRANKLEILSQSLDKKRITHAIQATVFEAARQIRFKDNDEVSLKPKWVSRLAKEIDVVDSPYYNWRLHGIDPATFGQEFVLDQFKDTLFSHIKDKRYSDALFLTRGFQCGYNTATGRISVKLGPEKMPLKPNP